MSKLISIKEAADVLGVSVQTLRRWEREGKVLPVQRTAGGQRRFDLHALPIIPQPILKIQERPTLAYARVSSHDQKDDLVRQEKMLEMFCTSRGWPFEIISDLGSGMNYNKRGLKKLLQKILNENISRLVITHKDRLLRFGAELVFAICEMKEIEVVIIYPNNLKNWIWAEAKALAIQRSKRPPYFNIGVFLIVESRGFGSAEIPILAVVWV